MLSQKPALFQLFLNSYFYFQRHIQYNRYCKEQVGTKPFKELFLNGQIRIRQIILNPSATLCLCCFDFLLSQNLLSSSSLRLYSITQWHLQRPRIFGRDSGRCALPTKCYCTFSKPNINGWHVATRLTCRHLWRQATISWRCSMLNYPSGTFRFITGQLKLMLILTFF